jgi:exosortase F-associated protein
MKNKDWLEPDRKRRVLLILISITALVIVFIGQRFDYSLLFSDSLNSTYQFIINRTILFYDKRYVKFGLTVEAVGFSFLLIPYFILRFYTDIDHMYISFIHRLIINPTLMVLLIPAIYIQRSKINQS